MQKLKPKKPNHQLQTNYYLKLEPEQVVLKRRGMRAIHVLCANYACNELLDMLIAKPWLLKIRTKHGKNGFHYLCQNSKAFAIITKLLSNNVVASLINEPCNKGYTPIMYATKTNNFELLEMLRQHGADTNQVGCTEITLYHLASTNITLLKYVGQHTKPELATIPASRRCYLTAPWNACMNNNRECLKYMIENLQISFQCNNRTTFERRIFKVGAYALKYVTESKLPVTSDFILQLVRHARITGLVEDLLKNTPNIELAPDILFYDNTSNFPLFLNYITKPIPEFFYKHYFHFKSPSASTIKELVQHSLPLHYIRDRHNLPLRDITFRNVKICAFDESSLKKRISLFSHVNCKSLCYFDGKQWRNNFANWDMVPLEFTLVESNMFRAIPLTMCNVKFEFF